MLVYTGGIKNASEDSASFGQLPMSESSTGVKKPETFGNQTIVGI
jgi:hypothetical protein